MNNKHKLAANVDLSSRFHEEKRSDRIRNDFMRDRDRILYSKAFRRLAGKTQVYLAGIDDHSRTRLTHTLEVSQIARTISTGIGLDIDLTEAIALGHDIGHTPFGHAGERMLHVLLSPQYSGPQRIKNCIVDLVGEDIPKYVDKYGFKHNFQSVRFLIDYGVGHSENGLNLTNYTLWGIQNHSSPKYKADKVPTKNTLPSFYDNYFTYYAHEKNDKIPAWSFEAFVVQVADEIAQIHHDFEDAIRNEIVTKKDAEWLVRRYIKPHMSEDDKLKFSKIQKKPDSEEFITSVAHLVLNTLITKIIEVSIENLNDLLTEIGSDPNAIDDYFINNSPDNDRVTKCIGYSKLSGGKHSINKLENDIKKYRENISDKILNTADVQRSDSKGEYIIRKLFDAYYTNPKQLPDFCISRFLVETGKYKTVELLLQQRRTKGIGHIRGVFDIETKDLLDDLKLDEQKRVKKMILMRLICDNIAGMTDSYAIEEYNSLYD
jgi:dGTPase